MALQIPFVHPLPPNQDTTQNYSSTMKKSVSRPAASVLAAVVLTICSVLSTLTIFRLHGSTLAVLPGCTSDNNPFYASEIEEVKNTSTSTSSPPAFSSMNDEKLLSAPPAPELISNQSDYDAESYYGHDLTYDAPWRDATLRGRSSHPWPQVDNRIAKSIQEAIGIMPQNISWVEEKFEDGKLFYIWNSTRYEAPPKGLATVVTAYYDLKSKHPIHQYEGWFHKMLSATDPMIIFIDHTQFWGVNWLEYVKVRRNIAVSRDILRFQEISCCRLTRFLCWI